MEFRILGPLEAIEGGCPVELGGPKQRALLALLVLSANRVVSSDALIEALWEEQPPEKAQKALHVLVSQLRKALGGERIVTRAPGYLLLVEEGELDLERFEALVAAGRVDELREGLALWRGPPLAEFAYVRFAQAEIGRLEGLRQAALEQRIELEIAAGEHASLVGELESLVAEHPVRERLRGQLMLALYRSGRQAEALAVYQDARRHLVEELGIEPGKPLRELHQAILRQDTALDLAAAAVEPAAEQRRGVFVGRAPELAQLLAGLADAFAGDGRLFLLSGEPGIGKSRLADELISQARAQGARVLIGRCWEAGGAPAYWPWVQSLRAYVKESDSAVLRSQLAAGATDLAQILPELRQLFPDLPQPSSYDSEGARFRLFDATAEFLRNASHSQPIVLVLDDLHAADTPSLLLLQFLTRQLGSTRMLIIGAYRDVDPVPGPQLSALLAEVVREPVTRRLTLVGLSKQAVGEYVDLSDASIASAELAAALYEGTEGNPLFVAEAVRLLTLERPHHKTADTTIVIPQSVRDVIARRLTHLSAECNRALTFASVLGREFALIPLAQLSGTSEDELLDTLDEAAADRVITDLPGAPGRRRFGHALIRDTLYESLPSGRRIRLHRLALKALETLYGQEPGPHLAELTHHAVAGNDLNKGLEYAQRAGDRARTLLAYEEASRLYQIALTTLKFAGTAGPENHKLRCELLLAIGEAESAQDRFAAKKNFLEAAELARQLGLPEQLARAAIGYGGRIAWARAGGDDKLVPLLEEALAALPDTETELRVRLLARLAGALRDELSRDRRNALSKQAVTLARQTGNPAALAYALTGRAPVILAPDTLNECLASGSELCEVATQTSDRERLVHGHLDRYIAQVMLGNVHQAEADLGAATRHAQALKQPVQLWQTCASHAMVALAAGNLDQAEQLLNEALALGEHSQPEMAIPAYLLQHYALCDLRGRPADVESAIYGLPVEYPTRVSFRCAIIHLDAQLGRTAKAKDALENIVANDVSALPFDQEWLYGMSHLAETSALLADTHSAAILYPLLSPWANLNATDHPEGFRGSVSRYLGMLAATIGNHNDAQRHYELAVANNEKMGARPLLAQTQENYAHLLTSRNKPGDHQHSRDLLDHALTTYHHLGMHAHAARVTATTPKR